MRRVGSTRRYVQYAISRLEAQTRVCDSRGVLAEAARGARSAMRMPMRRMRARRIEALSVPVRRLKGEMADVHARVGVARVW
jgi:hypothetical protein